MFDCYVELVLVILVMLIGCVVFIILLVMIVKFFRLLILVIVKIVCIDVGRCFDYIIFSVLLGIFLWVRFFMCFNNWDGFWLFSFIFFNNFWNCLVLFFLNICSSWFFKLVYLLLVGGFSNRLLICLIVFLFNFVMIKFCFVVLLSFCENIVVLNCMN